MENEKLDIQVGDRVTFKYLDNNEIHKQIITYEGFIKDLINTAYYKILKIERPKYEVVEEKKELLTEEEREFLKDICKYYDIAKIQFGINLYFFTNEDCMIVNIKIPKNLHFENIEENRKYSLKELGLEEEQKSNY